MGQQEGSGAGGQQQEQPSPTGSRHLCQGSRERKELCALARHTLEMNEGKFPGKGVCTKHLEAFHAFLRWGQEGIGEKTVGWKCISNCF